MLTQPIAKVDVSYFLTPKKEIGDVCTQAMLNQVAG